MPWPWNRISAHVPVIRFVGGALLQPYVSSSPPRHLTPLTHLDFRPCIPSSVTQHCGFSCTSHNFQHNRSILITITRKETAPFPVLESKSLPHYQIFTTAITPYPDYYYHHSLPLCLSTLSLPSSAIIAVQLHRLQPASPFQERHPLRPSTRSSTKPQSQKKQNKNKHVLLKHLRLRLNLHRIPTPDPTIRRGNLANDQNHRNHVLRDRDGGRHEDQDDHNDRENGRGGQRV